MTKAKNNRSAMIFGTVMFFVFTLPYWTNQIPLLALYYIISVLVVGFGIGLYLNKQVEKSNNK